MPKKKKSDRIKKINAKLETLDKERLSLIRKRNNLENQLK